MSKKGENIYKRKDGRWEGRYIREYDSTGKAVRGSVYGKTYCETKQKLIGKKSLIQQIPGNQSAYEESNMTYSDLLAAWLVSTKLNIKESTYARYSQLINNHITPALGGYKISSITTRTIEGFVSHLLTNGRVDCQGGLSPKTVNDILTIIKSTSDYAKLNNYYLPCNLAKLSIKKKEKEIRVFSHAEQTLLLKELLDETDYYKFGVLLSLYTGIRIGELCALQWEDIDISNSTIKIRKTLQRIQNVEKYTCTSKTRIIITEPKSDSSIRDIPMPDFITDIAKKFIKAPKAYILSGNERYIEPRTMQNRFKNYLKKAGIIDANFHALRHTFATRCVEVGFEIKSLSEVLGHSTVNITLNRYVHSSFAMKATNMNKLSLYI